MLVLAGVAVLVLKPHYHGPLARIFHDYGGNVAVSFAVFFLALRLGKGRWFAAASALLAVELFEIADGFGIMANVYDPVDLLANAAGIGLAFAIDSITGQGHG